MLLVITLKTNPDDWQHLLLGNHPNSVEFLMKAHFFIYVKSAPVPDAVLRHTNDSSYATDIALESIMILLFLGRRQTNYQNSVTSILWTLIFRLYIWINLVRIYYCQIQIRQIEVVYTGLSGYKRESISVKLIS